MPGILSIEDSPPATLRWIMQRAYGKRRHRMFLKSFRALPLLLLNVWRKFRSVKTGQTPVDLPVAIP